MSVNIDNSGIISGATVSSLTFNISCAGANRLLFVAAGGGESPTPVVSGVAINGLNATQIWSTGDSIWTSSYGFYYLNEPTGNVTVRVVFSGSLSQFIAGGLSCTNVNQASPTGNFFSSGYALQSTAENPTFDIATISSDLVATSCMTDNNLGLAIGGSGILREYGTMAADTDFGIATSVTSSSPTTRIIWNQTDIGATYNNAVGAVVLHANLSSTRRVFLIT